jgi:hypothetical protein
LILVSILAHDFGLSGLLICLLGFTTMMKGALFNGPDLKTISPMSRGCEHTHSMATSQELNVIL